MTSEVPIKSAMGQHREPPSEPLQLHTQQGTPYCGTCTKFIFSISAIHLYHQFVNLLLFHKGQRPVTWGRPSGFTDVFNSL